MRRLIGALLVSLTAAAVLLIAAPVAGAAEPTGDPSADDYSPWVWINAWSATGAIDDARAGDVTEGLQHSGMVIAVIPDQLDALTAADKAQLNAAWRGNGLLQQTWNRASSWASAAFQAVAAKKSVPEWSAADADSVAGDLGGTSYSALSPGLKSVVQRIATIVTGDSKPVMPDEAWSSWMTPAVRAGWDARPEVRFVWSAVSQTPPGVAADPGSQVTMQCRPGALNWLCQAAQAVAGAVVAAVEFVSNPLGYLAAAFSAAAAGVMTFVATVANHGTAADLTASWWISAYTKGLAIGVVLLGFVLLLEILQVARRRAGAEDLLETVSIWVPAWFAGVLFGPAVAQFLITGSGYLTDGIVSSMTGYGAGDAFTAVAKATKEASQAQQLGELVMALLTAIAVLVSALAVFISLCIQAVIIYLASAVFAIGWVWILTTRHRETAWRIPRLFLGLVFSKALLFFLLGVAMAIAAASTAMTGDGIAKNLGLIVMACAAMLLAAFSPLILLRHAPVIPGTSTSTAARDTTDAAGRGGRSAARGGRAAAQGAGQPGKGLNRLSALAAKSRRGGTGTVIGGGERPSRTPAPTPAAGPAGRGPSAGRSGSGTSRAGRPNPTSAGGPTSTPGRGVTGSPPGTSASSGSTSGTRPGPAGPGRPVGRSRGTRTSTPPPPPRSTTGDGAGTAAAAAVGADPAPAPAAPSASWAAAAAPTPARAAGAWQTRLARELDGTGPHGLAGNGPVTGESS